MTGRRDWGSFGIPTYTDDNYAAVSLGTTRHPSACLGVLRDGEAFLRDIVLTPDLSSDQSYRAYIALPRIPT